MVVIWETPQHLPRSPLLEVTFDAVDKSFDCLPTSPSPLFLASGFTPTSLQTNVSSSMLLFWSKFLNLTFIRSQCRVASASNFCFFFFQQRSNLYLFPFFRRFPTSPLSKISSFTCPIWAAASPYPQRLPSPSCCDASAGWEHFLFPFFLDSYFRGFPLSITTLQIPLTPPLFFYETEDYCPFLFDIWEAFSTRFRC